MKDKGRDKKKKGAQARERNIDSQIDIKREGGKRKVDRGNYRKRQTKRERERQREGERERERYREKIDFALKVQFTE